MTGTEPTPAGWADGQRDDRVRQLRQLPRRVRVLLAAEWARGVLPIFESERPSARGPRQAVEAAERWAAEPNEENRKAAAAAAGVAYAAAAYAYASAEAAYAYAASAEAAYAAAAYAAAAYAYASAEAASAEAAYAEAAYAAYAAAEAAYAARTNRWLWLYATYRHARGPDGAAFDPRWRTESAVALARGIVAGRAFDRMPILADALEEAGCDHPEVLAHLRGDPADEMTAADWPLWQLLGYGA